MGISLQEAMQRVYAARTLSDIKAIFQDFFGKDIFNVDEGTEAKNFRHILGVEKNVSISTIVAAEKANPNFKNGGVGYHKNYQRCIAVFEMRKRGYGVIAKPKLTSANEDGIYSSQDCFINPVSIGRRGGISQPILNREQLKERLKELGDGARAAICWTRPGDGRQGHTIACEIMNGEIFFVDPQTGRHGDRVLGEANEDGYSFFQMNHLEFDEQKLELIAEREPS